MLNNVNNYKSSAPTDKNTKTAIQISLISFEGRQKRTVIFLSFLLFAFLPSHLGFCSWTVPRFLSALQSCEMRLRSMLVVSIAGRHQLHVYQLIDHHNYAGESGLWSVMTASLIVLAVSYDPWQCLPNRRPRESSSRPRNDLYPLLTEERITSIPSVIYAGETNRHRDVTKHA